LIKNNISVYCSHTNLDKAEFGTDYALAMRLGLQKISTLSAEESEKKLCKIAVYVPEEHERNVFDAMAAAGAGHIGNYSHCSFRTSGLGTFLPLEGTNPYVGQIGSIENVKETRLEMVAPESILDNVVSAMVKVHPYEEVAYDVYQLANRSHRHGLGRIGTLPHSVRLSDYLKQMCEILHVGKLDVSGDLDKEILKVAVCAGSGADMAISAKNSGADLFVTGEIKYHKAIELKSMGMPVVAAGHYATEAPVMCWLNEHLQKIACALQYNVEILLPDTVTEPFHTLVTNYGRLDS
jgi:dinuclear metal center YbgI/SA1388 family protein